MAAEAAHVTVDLGYVILHANWLSAYLCATKMLTNASEVMMRL